MNDLGFLVVYLSWGFGVATIVAGLMQLWRRPDDKGPSARRRVIGATLTILGAIGVIGSLALPWISGVSAGGHHELVESGWTGLDRLTTVAIAGLCLLAVAFVLHWNGGGPFRRVLMLSSGGCVLGLVGGNFIIQATTTRGSEVEWGAVVSLVAAAVFLCGVWVAAPRA